LQGQRLAGENLYQGSNKSTYNVWGKKLQDGSAVLLFLNNAGSAEDVTCGIFYL
jgi:hypothetical protein